MPGRVGGEAEEAWDANEVSGVVVVGVIYTTDRFREVRRQVWVGKDDCTTASLYSTALRRDWWSVVVLSSSLMAGCMWGRDRDQQNPCKSP